MLSTDQIEIHQITQSWVFCFPKSRINDNGGNINFTENYLHANFMIVTIKMHSTIYFFHTVAFAQVDWHDFVVVETVDFKDSETG